VSTSAQEQTPRILVPARFPTASVSDSESVSPFCTILVSKAVCTASRSCHSYMSCNGVQQESQGPMTRTSVSQALVIIKQGTPIPPRSDSQSKLLEISAASS
jgi:hypothetical protein